MGKEGSTGCNGHTLSVRGSEANPVLQWMRGTGEVEEEKESEENKV